MSEAQKARPTLAPGSRVTLGEKYGYACEAIHDQAAAAEYFEACVRHCMSFLEPSMHEATRRQEAERIERANLGYYAGYYDNDTRQRVERLFSCAHPIFGKAGPEPVDPGKALLAGVVAATTNPTTAALLAQFGQEDRR